MANVGVEGPNNVAVGVGVGEPLEENIEVDEFDDLNSALAAADRTAPAEGSGDPVRTVNGRLLLLTPSSPASDSASASRAASHLNGGGPRKRWKPCVLVVRRQQQQKARASALIHENGNGVSPPKRKTRQASTQIVLRECFDFAKASPALKRRYQSVSPQLSQREKDELAQQRRRKKQEQQQQRERGESRSKPVQKQEARHTDVPTETVDLNALSQLQLERYVEDDQMGFGSDVQRGRPHEDIFKPRLGKSGGFAARKRSVKVVKVETESASQWMV